MKSFREYVDNRYLQERVLRKGAVAAYASNARKHGEDATKRYRSAQRILALSKQNKSNDEKIDIIVDALEQISLGLISKRKQIGSLSAQLTAISFL